MKVMKGDRVRVLDGARKSELGTVTGHGPHGTPLVKLDSLAFSQPGLNVEPALRPATAAVLEVVGSDVILGAVS